MTIDEPKIAMRSLRSVLSAEEFRELSERALEISARLEQSEQQRFAEVYPEVAPHWHVATVHPGQERLAADDLSDKRFGVYLPESEHTEVRRGRAIELKRLMLPGYVFVFVWDVNRHLDRIRNCKGVRGLLCVNGQVAIVSDRLIDGIRRAENLERPLKGLVDRPRRRRKGKPAEIPAGCFTADEIIGVHSYSPYLEDLRSGSDGERVAAFHRAMGLAA